MKEGTTIDITTYRKIRARMAERGITFAKIGEDIGVTRQAVWQAAAGRSNSARIREAIAKAIGSTVGRIWPKDVAA